MATDRYRVSDLLGETMAELVEHPELDAISVQLKLPRPAAFEICHPSPDLQTVTRALVAFLAWPASWQVDSDHLEA